MRVKEYPFRSGPHNDEGMRICEQHLNGRPAGEAIAILGTAMTAVLQIMTPEQRRKMVREIKLSLDESVALLDAMEGKRRGGVH